MTVRVYYARKQHASVAVDAQGTSLSPGGTSTAGAASVSATGEDLESGYEMTHNSHSGVAMPLVEIEGDGSVPIGRQHAGGVLTTAEWVEGSGRGGAGGGGVTGRVVDIPSSYVVVVDNNVRK